MSKQIDPEITKLILEVQDNQEKLRILDKTIEELKKQLKPLEEERTSLYRAYENSKGLLNHKLYNKEKE